MKLCSSDNHYTFASLDFCHMWRTGFEMWHFSKQSEIIFLSAFFMFCCYFFKKNMAKGEASKSRPLLHFLLSYLTKMQFGFIALAIISFVSSRYSLVQKYNMALRLNSMNYVLKPYLMYVFGRKVLLKHKMKLTFTEWPLVLWKNGLNFKSFWILFVFSFFKKA